MTSPDGRADDNKWFDRRFCKKVVQIGGAACVAITLTDVLFMATFDASYLQCGPPIIAAYRHLPWQAWMPVLLVGFSTALICYGAASWDALAQRYADYLDGAVGLTLSETERGPAEASTSRRRRNANGAIEMMLNIDFGWMLIAFMMACAGFCALPILALLKTCYWAQ